MADVCLAKHLGNMSNPEANGATKTFKMHLLLSTSFEYFFLLYDIVHLRIYKIILVLVC